MNAAGLHRAADAHPVRSGRSAQRLDLRNRMVIRLALAVAQPCQARHGHHDDSDSNPEFGLFFHRRHLPLLHKSESYHRPRTADVSWLTLSASFRPNGRPSFSTSSPPNSAPFSSSTTAVKSSVRTLAPFGPR